MQFDPQWLAGWWRTDGEVAALWRVEQPDKKHATQRWCNDTFSILRRAYLRLAMHASCGRCSNVDIPTRRFEQIYTPSE